MAVVAFSAVGATPSGDIAGYRATPYGSLLEALEAAGHRFVEPNDQAATHFLSLDHNARTFAQIANRIPRAQRILVAFEPRMVIPANYRRSVRRAYGAVHLMAPVNGSDYFAWPQRDWRATQMSTRVIDRVPGSSAIINSNKISFIRGSLYGLRRRVIDQYARDGQPLTLAGPNWARRGGALFMENLRSLAYAILNREPLDLREWAGPLPLEGSIEHLGRIDDKDDVYRASEFAVVIENSKTYVSEKLFDALFAGCVPLYVGPNLSDYGIPPELAITLPADPGAFTSAVRELDAQAKARVLETGRAWLAEDATYARWAMRPSLAALASGIDSSLTSAS